MRAILLSPQIETMAVEYSKSLFSTRDVRFVKPSIKLADLKTALRPRRGVPADYQNYVSMIISTYRVLNAIKPDKYQKLHTNFYSRFDNTVDLSKKITVSGECKSFYKHITEAMRYDAVRDKEFLPYAKALNISTCVYCNANYALTIQVKKDKIGKFELDHFKPQSSRPYLCTNFYNLYPVCANCNKYKLHKLTLFSLYTDDPAQILPFSFTLDKKSIIKYMLTQNFDDLKVSFHAPMHPDHNDTFKIEATYSALKDVVEELVWKHKIYNTSYLKTLSNAFTKKFSYSGLHRFILGNYDQWADIHKRPLTKLTQDIAEQLGILKFK
jgi:hypothetical protein